MRDVIFQNPEYRYIYAFFEKFSNTKCGSFSGNSYPLIAQLEEHPAVDFAI